MTTRTIACVVFAAVATSCDVAESGSTGADANGARVDATAVDASTGGDAHSDALPASDDAGPYDYSDNRPPSQSPPGGLAPAQVPMFVMLSFDDNMISGLPGTGVQGVDGLEARGGMSWLTNMLADKRNPAGRGNPATHDGAPCHVTFFHTGQYIDSSGALERHTQYLKTAWHDALTDGHEAANHTHHHVGAELDSVARAEAELIQCSDFLRQPFDEAAPLATSDDETGIGAGEIIGYRQPFLGVNNFTLAALVNQGFAYDSSIEEGFYDTSQDGTNYFWPYTLDSGSPGNSTIGAHPGLWEIPLHALIIPPDSEAARYNFPPGLRGRCYGSKITAFDYNTLFGCQLTKNEFLAILEYSLDLRLAGNRAPLMIGTHSNYFSTAQPYGDSCTLAEAQAALEEFVDYALSKPEVRLVSARETLQWLRSPTPL